MRRIELSLIFGVAVGLSLVAAPFAVAQSALQYEQARHALVQEVLVGGGIKNERVLKSMRDTPRHEFVPQANNLRRQAYFDMALPIGDQQTISSPFIVAFMTESIDPRPTDKVLEIGTGSGFQAAVLSPLVKEVYSIEIVKRLGDTAAKTLKRLDYKNVFTKVGDGYLGWPDKAPFDKIIVTCSPEKVPQPLVDQLREGGRMVIPVGERYQQTLYLLTKKDGKLISEKLLPTLFVPMTGKAEDSRLVKPDPLHPRAVNGDFEIAVDSKSGIPGWYYLQQGKLVEDSKAPSGKFYVTFSNQDSGRTSALIQGFGIDGRKIGELDVSAQIKLEDVVPSGDAGPTVAITFYDEDRRDLGTFTLEIERGTSAWHKISKKMSVPQKAKEGILRIGLYGATGEASFDDVKMVPVNR
jgi:protein-L-isoaspartate(D-aspartate) O-methyltransferase